MGDTCQRISNWSPRGPIASDTLWKTGAIEDHEIIDRRTAMADAMMMGLRLNHGMLNSKFRRRFGTAIDESFPSAVEECLRLGLLEWAKDSLRLTEGGRLLGNEAFQRFVNARPNVDG